jgi:hypothetical protein
VDKVMVTGTVLLGVAITSALSGSQIIHFWKVLLPWVWVGISPLSGRLLF